MHDRTVGNWEPNDWTTTLQMSVSCAWLRDPGEVMEMVVLSTLLFKVPGAGAPCMELDISQHLGGGSDCSAASSSHPKQDLHLSSCMPLRASAFFAPLSRSIMRRMNWSPQGPENQVITIHVWCLQSIDNLKQHSSAKTAADFLRKVWR